MSVELKIPDVGESIREVQIGRWLKREGDSVAQDENVVELETDKASMELPAPEAGVMGKILKGEGEVVGVGDVIGYLETDGGAAAKETDQAEPTTHQGGTDAKSRESEPGKPADEAPPSGADGKEKKKASGKAEKTASPAPAVHESSDASQQDIAVTPAARRALREHGLTAADVAAKGSRLQRKDVLRHVEQQQVRQSAAPPKTEKSDATPRRPERGPTPDGEESEEVVPLSLIRRRIAERLVQAQRDAALLTTFNEIDMSSVKRLRAEYGERFREKFGVKLGFMSFFVKAVVDALQSQPELNAEIRGDTIVYRHYYHIGIAVSSEKGLVVPVLRFAERLSFAEIEQAIDDFSRRAAANKLAPKDLERGTFTITNGGVFGSLLSTPIVNPPQSGVLGMHGIQDRPVARDGQVVIRPMMYVALTYDHRVVDGREAVLFLKRIKETLEDPARMLLEV